MGESADWSDLSSQLLTKIFELQHNALDNCAAACICASWRCAVNSSHISFLHLHAERSFSYKHWSNFLLSKPSVGTLRLTASADFTWNTTADLFWARTFLQQIASTCDHLDADEAFATELRYLALQPAQLKKLTVWLLRPHYTTRCCMFPDIRHLTQLTALHIQLNNKPPSPLVGSETLSRIPESLDDLIIDGYNLRWRQVVPPSIQPLIQPCLAFIQSLQLKECRVAFIGGSITCLCTLKSFSADSSRIWADVSNLDKLTKLTCLDLARSTWHESRNGRPFPDPSGPFASFAGWPELKVLKIADCNLFCPSTQLDLPGVQEVHVDWVVPKLVDIRLHLHQSLYEYTTFDPQGLLHPSCATCLVDLRLKLGHRVLGTGFCAMLQQVLCICNSLQVLHLSTFGDVNLDNIVNIRLHEHCGEQLTQLHLVYVSCNILDLASSAFLTSVKLHRVRPRHGAAFQLSLPSSLRSLDYWGDLLFGSACRQQLQHCSQLTYLAISPEKLYKLPECELPLLPSSLYHLQLRIKDHEWISGRSWIILKACTNLERLTLPGKCILSGDIKETADALRHLHVVDHD